LTKFNSLKYYLIILIALFANKVMSQQYTEYDLKAAYVYNFSKFVTWPSYAFENDQSSFDIVVLGESPITKVLLKALKDRKILNRNISIKVINNVEEIRGAQLVFLSKNMQAKTKEVVAYCKNKPILLVGDVIEGFCQSGGTINFTPKASKYRFEINNQATKSSQIVISSKLLALARIINGDEIKF